MIGILELEREEKRRAKIEKQLVKQNRNAFDDEQKKLLFLEKFCNPVRYHLAKSQLFHLQLLTIS